MITIRQILFLCLVLLFSVNLFSAVDTACVYDEGVRYGIQSDTYNSISVWTVEGTDRGIEYYQINDTIQVDWLTADTGWYTISVREYNVFNKSDGDTVSCEGAIVYDSVYVVGPIGVDIEPTTDMEICFGDSVIFTSNSVYYSYFWHNGETGNTITEYSEGYVSLEVTDKYGCSLKDSTYLTVHDLPVIDLGPDIVVCGDNSLYFDFSNEGVYFSWYAGNEEFSNSPFNEIEESFIYLYNTDTISLRVENAYGCINSDTLVIMPCSDILGVIPTVITPNADGKNDKWIIDRIEKYPYNYPDLVIQIFDRWGKLVWESDPGYIGNEFEGIDLKGRELPSDSYFYVIDLKNGGDPVTGHLTILR